MAEEASSLNCSMVNSSCRGSGTNLFYLGNNNTFNESSAPNSYYYNGTSAGFGLSSISAPGQVMTAAFALAPFSIATNYPADNASAVGMGTRISVKFNKAVNPSTLNNSTFKLIRNSTQVVGSISYDTATRTASIIPSAPLAANTLYSVSVTTGVQDQNGNQLTAGKNWGFTTGSTFFNETFDSEDLPAGWTTRDNEGNGKVWAFNDPDDRGNLTGGTGGFAIVDSDYIGSVDVDTELRTPAIDLSGYGGAQLSFKVDFNSYGSEVADVDISTNGGSSWANIWTKSGSDYRGPVTESINISQFAGNDNVIIRFHYYNANWEWWWEVDDVTVTVSSPVPVERTLNAGVSGTGSGAVTITPGGIAFNTNYVGQFNSGAQLALSPSASEYSVFTGWSGACAGIANCNLTMDSDKNVTAIFNKDTRMTRIGDTSTYFSTLQAAYNGAPASSTVKVWGTEFTENLNCALQKDVALEGGYNGSYSSNSGFTTLTGVLTIAAGSLSPSNLVIK
jgi:hypothetical protein